MAWELQALIPDPILMIVVAFICLKKRLEVLKKSESYLDLNMGRCMVQVVQVLMEGADRDPRIMEDSFLP
jgi:hypothetical protein